MDSQFLDFMAHGLPNNAVVNPKKLQHFSPYVDNGGSVIAIAGEDFAVIASDERLSLGFQIYSREQPKLFQLTPYTVLGSSGCWCDILTFTRVLEARLKMYEHEHHKQMTTPAIAQLVSVMLYYKRFFPYYISNIVAGIDGEGRGCVFSFDPVGHCEKEQFRAGGSSNALLQPLLDNQIGYKNIENAVPQPISLAKAVAIIKDTFISAAERDIYTGDGIIINIINKDGTQVEKFPLRKD